MLVFFTLLEIWVCDFLEDLQFINTTHLIRYRNHFHDLLPAGPTKMKVLTIARAYSLFTVSKRMLAIGGNICSNQMKNNSLE